MATNYSKWDKFDVSQEADACEKRWEVDALEEESGRVAMQLQQATSAVHQSTLRSAESLKSKVRDDCNVWLWCADMEGCLWPGGGGAIEGEGRGEAWGALQKGEWHAYCLLPRLGHVTSSMYTYTYMIRTQPSPPVSPSKRMCRPSDSWPTLLAESA